MSMASASSAWPRSPEGVHENLFGEGVIALGNLLVGDLGGEKQDGLADSLDEGCSGGMVAVIVGRDEVSRALGVQPADNLLPFLGIGRANGAVHEHHTGVRNGGAHVGPVVARLDV